MSEEISFAACVCIRSVFFDAFSAISTHVSHFISDWVLKKECGRDVFVVILNICVFLFRESEQNNVVHKVTNSADSSSAFCNEVYIPEMIRQSHHDVFFLQGYK